MKGKILVVTIFILLLATFLRFHNLDAQSFWNDEGNSARLSERSLQLIIEGTASDIHPPLYYLLLRGWRELVGDTEFGLRSLSAFAGLMVVAGTLALGRDTFQHIGAETQRDKWFTWTAVLLGSLITAVSPPLIYYSQEARMYALLALEATLSTLFFVLWWQEIKQKPKERSEKKIILLALGYVFLATAGLYTQYAFPAVILAQNVMFLILIARDWRLEMDDDVSFNIQSFGKLRISSLLSDRTRPILAWISMMFAIFLLYLPWLPIFLGNIGGGPAERPLINDYLLNVFRWLAFGHTATAEQVAGPLATVFIFMGLGMVLERGWRTAVWLAAFLVPILTAYYVGAFEPQLFKLLLVVTAPFAIMLSLILFAARPKARRTKEDAVENYFFFGKWRLQFISLLVILGGLFAFGIVQSLANLYTNPDYARADYRAIAARIAADNHNNAAIILNAPNQWEVFTYYHSEGAPVYPLPLSGMAREEITAELADIANSHERLYVVYWGDGQQDPERIIESWLDENTYKAVSEWYQDVRFVVMAVPVAAADHIETVVAANFGAHITLHGYTLSNRNLAPGDILQITLFWQTDSPLTQRYKVFLHLLDANGQLVAQRDSEPGSTLKPTTIWQSDETVIDNHGILIPTDLPSEQYTLVLGLYDIADPSVRIPIASKGVTLDALSLETITVSIPQS